MPMDAWTTPSSAEKHIPSDISSTYDQTNTTSSIPIRMTNIRQGVARESIRDTKEQASGHDGRSNDMHHRISISAWIEPYC
jgi:hypothetical protein